MDTSLVFNAIGTRWKIEYASPDARIGISSIRNSIDNTILEFDRSFSRFRNDSWVNLIRATPGTYQLPTDAYQLLHLYQAAYAATNGYVTPIIGHVMEQAGYDAHYSLVSTAIEKVPDFDKVLSFDQHTITTKYPVLLDFGAAGKGYLIDKIGTLLKKADVKDFVINAGGDILRYSRDNKPVIIGLEDPDDFSKVVGTCALKNGSLCASAGSRRHWENFTHIINPKTLASPTSVSGVWVKAETAAVADIVATALFFVSPSDLRSYFQFSYAVLKDDRTIVTSRNFELHTFTEAGR